MPFLAAIPAAIAGIAGTAAGSAAIAGGATALGSGVVGGMMGGGAGKGTQFQAGQGVNANDVQFANNGVNSSLQQQQDFLTALQAQNGIQNQSNVYNQYSDIAAGKGPNPAQAMLANQTGNNIASQASLMAGQRGSSSNAGLIARQAGQQGAGIQQQAVGQGALMQAQQSLGALGQMGNLATQQVGQQQSATNALSSANLQRQQQFESGLNQQSQINSGVQGQIAAGQIQGAQGVAGGLGTGLAGALGVGKSPAAVKKAHGGPVNYAEGGPVSNVGRHLIGMAKGGKVPAMVSPGEVYLPPNKVKEVAKDHKNPLKAGEHIKGKAKVKGDSEKNDTVAKTLDTGGIVIPRTKAKDSDKAAKFVQAIVAKKGLRK